AANVENLAAIVERLSFHQQVGQASLCCRQPIELPEFGFHGFHRNLWIEDEKQGGRCQWIFGHRALDPAPGRRQWPLSRGPSDGHHRIARSSISLQYGFHQRTQARSTFQRSAHQPSRTELNSISSFQNFLCCAVSKKQLPRGAGNDEADFHQVQSLKASRQKMKRSAS